MAATKIQFESRRKIPTLKPKRRKVEQKSSPQDCLRCCTSSGGRSQASTSHSKTTTLQKGFTKPSPGRETQTFSQKLRNYNRGLRYSILNKRLQNTILSQPVQD